MFEIASPDLLSLDEQDAIPAAYVATINQPLSFPDEPIPFKTESYNPFDLGKNWRIEGGGAAIGGAGLGYALGQGGVIFSDILRDRTFLASLAIYGSFDLTDALAFFKALSDEFDPQIKAAALPQVVAKAEEMATKFSAQDIRSTPAYKKIFQVTGFSGTNPLDIEFKTKSGTTDPNEFADNLEAMIEQSSDPASRETIKTLSYSYINAALTKAGFFAPDPDPKQSKGMWLCGDYSFGADPFLDFQFGQDTMKVQVTTARQISRLFALVHLKKLVSDRHSQAMQDLLSNSNLSFLSTITPPITDFDVVLRKVGVDSGRISEGELLKWSNTTQFEQHGLTGEAAMCWHNLRSFVSGGQEFKGILRVIRETVAHYLNNAP